MLNPVYTYINLQGLIHHKTRPKRISGPGNNDIKEVLNSTQNFRTETMTPQGSYPFAGDSVNVL